MIYEILELTLDLLECAPNDLLQVIYMVRKYILKTEYINNLSILHCYASETKSNLFSSFEGSNISDLQFVHKT